MCVRSLPELQGSLQPLLQHGWLVFLCPSGVLPRFSRCKLRKDFTLRLHGLSRYLPLAGGSSFTWQGQLLSADTGHQVSSTWPASAWKVNPDSYDFQIPFLRVTGELQLSNCFVFPISGEVKIISGFSASVQFKYETNRGMTFLLIKALETELNKKNTGFKSTHSRLIWSTAWSFEGLFFFCGSQKVVSGMVLLLLLLVLWLFLCLSLCLPLILIHLHVLIAVE